MDHRLTLEPSGDIISPLKVLAYNVDEFAVNSDFYNNSLKQPKKRGQHGNPLSEGAS